VLLQQVGSAAKRLIDACNEAAARQADHMEYIASQGRTNDGIYLRSQQVRAAESAATEALQRYVAVVRDSMIKGRRN
jgi:hypothetical protein